MDEDELSSVKVVTCEPVVVGSAVTDSAVRSLVTPLKGSEGRRLALEDSVALGSVALPEGCTSVDALGVALALASLASGSLWVDCPEGLATRWDEAILLVACSSSDQAGVDCDDGTAVLAGGSVNTCELVSTSGCWVTDAEGEGSTMLETE